MSMRCSLLALTALVASVSLAQRPERSIPPEFRALAHRLVGHGLADIRQAGKPHLIRIRIQDAAFRSFRQSDHVVKTVGWVLPGGNEGVSRNGIAYPLVQDLGPVDASELLVDSSGTDPLNMGGPSQSLVALLISTGHDELAHKAFNACYWDGNGFELIESLMDQYRFQAAARINSRDDQDALAWAEPIVEIEAVRREFALQPPVGTFPVPSSEDYLKLVRDLRRRVEHPREKLSLASLKDLSQSERINSLIAALEDVDAVQQGQPGGISWREHEVVRALVAEGAAAVPALFDTLESDDRLTRSVGFHRDFGPQRFVGSVRAAASSALSRIWPAFSAYRGYGTPPPVSTLREAYKRAAGKSNILQWLIALADDSAQSTTWDIAARNLTALRRAPEDKSLFEQLSQSERTELSALLGRRAVSFARSAGMNSAGQQDYVDAAKYAQMREDRFTADALETWKTLCNLGEPFYQHWGTNDLFAGPYTHAIVRRIELGDALALGEYSTWFSRASKKELGSDVAWSTRPLWFLSGRKEIDKAATSLYKRWIAEFAHSPMVGWSTPYLLSSPLIATKPFRQFLREALSLTNPLPVQEALTWGQGPRLRFGFENNTTDLDLENPSEVQGKLTFGDYVALRVGSLQGERTPADLLRGTPKQRAARRESLRAWLADDSILWTGYIKGNRSDPMGGEPIALWIQKHSSASSKGRARPDGK